MAGEGEEKQKLIDKNFQQIEERALSGISEEEIQRTCAMFDDCGDCPLKEYCESEGEKQN